jgi:3-oxoacyl-[acyl-carrier protein] reductase
VDLELKGRTALVTGASSGIGRATAVHLAREGVRVALLARRAAPLDETADAIAAEGLPRPLVVPADITADDDLDGAVERMVAELGAVDILVNSAGGRVASGLAAEDAQWDTAMRLNFDAQRRLTQRVLPHMTERRFGRIVFVTGKSEPQVAAGTFSAKAATHAFAKGLSREMGRHGITVNCLAPGRIRTAQMMRHYDAEARAAQVRDIPVGRYGEPEDMARLAVFLASPLSDFVSGTVIPVDGGMRWYQF